MCLIIAAPPNINIPDAHIRRAMQNNSNGSGFAYVSGGKIVLKKGIFNIDEMLDKYQTAFKENPKSRFLMHFRIRTHGTVSSDNCHPFLGDYGAMAHNGVINIDTKGSDSDTKALANIIEKLPANKVDDFLERASDYLGHNRIVFLLPSNRFRFFNEPKGHWKDGAWYSNSSYNIGMIDRGGSLGS